ncbi:hypothetical protein AB4Y38_35555, partial [Paraburkholderia sp. EG285A]
RARHQHPAYRALIASPNSTISPASRRCHVTPPSSVGFRPPSTPDTRITMQEFAPPTSPVFDSGVVKLGLLGPALAEEVAFVYEQIRAFRLGLQRISKHHPEMERETVAQVLEFCLTLITTAQERGTKLIADLQRYANEGYWRTRPWVWWTRNLG